MKINIYYGGRGLLDDPTLYVLSRMEDVLRELRVSIEHTIYMSIRMRLRLCHRHFVMRMESFLQRQ